MDSHIVVYITASSQEEADTLSRGLVESKLAFCVNSVPGEHVRPGNHLMTDL